MKLISITWEDSRQIYGWTLNEDVDTSVCIIKTVGFLIKETETAYVVALSVGDNPRQYNGINVIPKRCVRRLDEKVTISTVK